MTTKKSSTAKKAAPRSKAAPQSKSAPKDNGNAIPHEVVLGDTAYPLTPLTGERLFTIIGMLSQISEDLTAAYQQVVSEQGEDRDPMTMTLRMIALSFSRCSDSYLRCVAAALIDHDQLLEAAMYGNQEYAVHKWRVEHLGSVDYKEAIKAIIDTTRFVVDQLKGDKDFLSSLISGDLRDLMSGNEFMEQVMSSINGAQ